MVLVSIDIPYIFNVYYVESVSLSVFNRVTISSFLSVFDEHVFGTTTESEILVSTHLFVDTFKPVNVTYILLATSI